MDTRTMEGVRVIRVLCCAHMHLAHPRRVLVVACQQVGDVAAGEQHHACAARGQHIHHHIVGQLGRNVHQRRLQGGGQERGAGASGEAT
jgi:hypothetical protein